MRPPEQRLEGRNLVLSIMPNHAGRALTSVHCVGTITADDRLPQVRRTGRRMAIGLIQGYEPMIFARLGNAKAMYACAVRTSLVGV